MSLSRPRKQKITECVYGQKNVAIQDKWNEKQKYPTKGKKKQQEEIMHDDILMVVQK